MKKITTTLVLLLAVTATAFSQSDSFITLREKFGGEKDVFSFRTSGGFARFILNIAGEHDWKEAIEEVRSIRFIVVPKRVFHEKRLTVEGFRKLTKSDGFEEIARVRDHGDDVHILMRPGKNDNNRYLVLVDESDEFVAFEIRGYIDPEKVRKEIAYNNR